MELTQQPELTLEQRLEPVVVQRAELKAQIAALETQIESIDDEIKGELCREDVLKLDVAGYGLTYLPNQTRETLDKMRLVELGVSTETIKAATKTSKPFDRLDVRKKGK